MVIKNTFLSNTDNASVALRKLVEHARNFGEHNAVLTGWRHANGEHIVFRQTDPGGAEDFVAARALVTIVIQRC